MESAKNVRVERKNVMALAQAREIDAILVRCDRQLNSSPTAGGCGSRAIELLRRGGPDREARSRNHAPAREIVHVAAQSCQHLVFSFSSMLAFS